MRGVVLAGGFGSRLLPMTKVIDRHLLPVFDRPLILHPVETLIASGVDEILVVTGSEHAGAFVRLLGDGRSLGAREIYFACQEGEGGTAEALGRAEDFARGGPVCAMLGDNLFERDLGPQVHRFLEDPTGAAVLLTEVADPRHFDVARLRGDRVEAIAGKSPSPPSPYAVTGAYLYDASVFDIVRSLEPSRTGGLELAEVNRRYLERGQLRYQFVEGWWADVDTPESLLGLANLVARERWTEPEGPPAVFQSAAASAARV